MLIARRQSRLGLTAALLLFLTSWNIVKAESIKFLDSCKNQIGLYCRTDSDKKDVREIIRCLSKYEDELSTQCKQEIQRAGKVIQQTTPPGGGPLGLLGGMTGLGALAPMLSYEGRILPAGKKGENSPSMSENMVRMALPLFKGERETVALSLSGGNLHLGEKVNLDTGAEVPKNLLRTEMGLQYSHKLPGHKAYGIQGNFGYTGDEINPETQTYNLNVNYSYPGSKKGVWVLMLIFSNNNPLGDGVPVPGFFYIHKTETFTGVFGLPVLSMQWTPVKPWSFSFSALGPLIRSEVSYGAVDQTQFFTGVSWIQQRYLLSDREEKNDRLTFEEKRAEMGFRRQLVEKVFAEFKGGYSFDRFVYIGKRLFDKAGGEAELKDGLSASWSVKILF